MIRPYHDHESHGKTNLLSNDLLPKGQPALTLFQFTSIVVSRRMGRQPLPSSSPERLLLLMIRPPFSVDSG